MRLNMWMIANRLRVLEPEVFLKDNEPAVIKGVRLYSVEEYVYMYQKEDAVICSFKEEYMIFHGIPLNAALGMVQDVFEYYNTWEEQVRLWLSCMDFQKIVDSCDPFLSNPLVLLDANYKVMAMSSQYGSGDVDGEWQYLSENRFSSIKAVRELRARSTVSKFERMKNPDAILRIKLDFFGYTNVSKSIHYNQNVCGKLVIMEKERAVNKGDILLLSALSVMLAPYMEKMNFGNQYTCGSSVFSQLLLDSEVDYDVLEMQMKYYEWSVEDHYHLLLLSYRDKKADDMLVRLLRSVLLQSIPMCVSEIRDGHIAVIVNSSKQDVEALLEKIEPFLIRNDVNCGVSLETESILNLPYLYHQLENAERLYKQEADEYIYFFSDVAVKYILREKEMDKKIFAMYPPIRWFFMETKDTENDGLYTMHVYLKNNESIAETAKQLYMHRNTLIYRLKKMEEKLQLNLQDKKKCFYYHLSLELLDTFRDEME